MTDVHIGAEVSKEVISSDYFVGYQFKKYLLEIQQAMMIYCQCAKEKGIAKQ